MKTAIEIKNLCKHFTVGGTTLKVLNDINLNIYKGEFVSIMGPSGSGKSTLLYLIGSLDKPTSGSILIGGKDIAVMSDQEESVLRRRDIGFVFQFYNLIPNLTVEENVLLPILLDGGDLKAHQGKLKEILGLVGLEDRRYHTPKELSGGQQQRVAIARALINDPEVILADEPIGNLDSKTGHEIMRLLEKLNREKGTTIIQVTHSTEAAEYTPRVIHVRDGAVISHSQNNKEDIA